MNQRHTAFGETKTLKQWSLDPRCVVSLNVLYGRLRSPRNATFEEILTDPVWSKSEPTEFLTAFGETKSVRQWAIDPRCMVSLRTLYRRFGRDDITPEEMLTVKKLKYRRTDIQGLIGRVYGELTILESAGRDKHGHLLLRCDCACGGEKTTRWNNIRAGNARSCGCLHREYQESRGK